MLRIQACFVSLSFAGLVVLARSLNPIPSRTRPLNSSAPMVLWLKPWESRSLPDLPRTKQFLFTCHDQNKTPLSLGKAAFLFWGSRCFSAIAPRGHAACPRTGAGPILLCMGLFCDFRKMHRPGDRRPVWRIAKSLSPCWELAINSGRFLFPP